MFRRTSVHPQVHHWSLKHTVEDVGWHLLNFQLFIEIQKSSWYTITVTLHSVVCQRRNREPRAATSHDRTVPHNIQQWHRDNTHILKQFTISFVTERKNEWNRAHVYSVGPGHRSGYSESLWDGRYGVRNPVRGTIFRTYPNRVSFPGVSDWAQYCWVTDTMEVVFIHFRIAQDRGGELPHRREGKPSPSLLFLQGIL